MDGPSVNWKLYDSIVKERNQNDDYPALIDIGSCNLHGMHGAIRSSVQKTKWELMVYSKPCTTCLMSPLKEEKINKILLDLRFFHCLSVDTDGLKRRKLQTELLISGPTLLGM